jgi:hypothetical protein
MEDGSISVFTLVKRDRLTRHDRGNCVLINQLGLAIAAQKHAKVVKPGDYALQFYPVDQKNRHRDFSLAHMIQERILKVLSVRRHIGFAFILAVILAGACGSGPPLVSTM